MLTGVILYMWYMYIYICTYVHMYIYVLCLWDISYPANLNRLIFMFVKNFDTYPLSKRWSNFGDFQTLILSNDYFTS